PVHISCRGLSELKGILAKLPQNKRPLATCASGVTHTTLLPRQGRARKQTRTCRGSRLERASEDLSDRAQRCTANGLPGHAYGLTGADGCTAGFQGRRRPFLGIITSRKGESAILLAPPARHMSCPCRPGKGCGWRDSISGGLHKDATLSCPVTGSALHRASGWLA